MFIITTGLKIRLQTGCLLVKIKQQMQPLNWPGRIYSKNFAREIFDYMKHLSILNICHCQIFTTSEFAGEHCFSLRRAEPKAVCWPGSSWASDLTDNFHNVVTLSDNVLWKVTTDTMENFTALCRWSFAKYAGTCTTDCRESTFQGGSGPELLLGVCGAPESVLADAQVDSFLTSSEELILDVHRWPTSPRTHIQDVCIRVCVNADMCLKCSEGSEWWKNCCINGQHLLSFTIKYPMKEPNNKNCSQRAEMQKISPCKRSVSHLICPMDSCTVVLWLYVLYFHIQIVDGGSVVLENVLTV